MEVAFYPVSRLFDLVESGDVKTPGSMAVLKLRNERIVDIFFGYRVAEALRNHFSVLLKEFLGREGIHAVYRLGSLYIVCSGRSVEGMRRMFGRFLVMTAHTPLQVRRGSFIYASFVAVIGGYSCFREETELDDFVWALERVALRLSRGDSASRVVVLSRERIEELMRKRRYYRLFLKAVKGDSLRVALQRIVDFDTGRTFAYESLARVVVGNEVIPAGAFINALSSLELEMDLDGLMIDRVLSLKKNGKISVKDRVSINISGRFLDQKFELLKDIVEYYQVDPEEIIIELTEREDMERVSDVERKLAELRGRGFLVFVDDFGTGYSNFHLLGRTEPDGVKIENDFIRGVEADGLKRHFLEFVVNLGIHDERKVVVECVESESDSRRIGEIKKRYGIPPGILLVQGYYYGRPEIVG